MALSWYLPALLQSLVKLSGWSTGKVKFSGSESCLGNFPVGLFQSQDLGGKMSKKEIIR